MCPCEYSYKNRSVGVWCKQSNKQDNGELRFIHKYAGKHVAQVTGTIDVAQISSTNGQQFTSNNSNSTFSFRNTNSQQITNNDSNSTFNNDQLTSFLARTADETPRLFQSINNTPVIQARSFYALPDRP
ncbi:hypothetical protein AVEN_35337-1 [Araneus ventricosus]|uniref:Uncharacterized protein n=1 Tax=Araneus ventricosus TaxID=182803 RepID=A0A4Y2VVE4_ARAVE|nr:hypothetical protein AVEN_35337-1 [Araneus ventricosus]